MLRKIFSSWLGITGVTIFSILALTALLVIATFPSGFGKEIWNNPAYWADNPKSAPPFWVELWDQTKTKHQVFESSIPSETLKDGSGETHLYRFRVEIKPNSYPSFLSFSLSGIQFRGAPPTVEAYLESGSDKILVHRHIVPALRPDENAPARRYFDVPFRARLDSEPDLKEEIRIFFEKLWQEGARTFDAVIKIYLTDPEDSIGSVKFVAGGHTFGWLGTDNIGHDIAKGILYGLPIALLVALTVALATTAIGAIIGGTTAYFGGWIDSLTQSIIYVKVNIPTLPIIIMLVYAFGSHLSYVILFLIVFGWSGLVLRIRPWVFQLREEGFIDYARASGFSHWRIIFRHILPQTKAFLLANFVLTAPGAILSEAALSFLGLGDPSLPTWGYMLNQGFRTGALLLGYWWWVLPPGIAIVITTFSFRLISAALESETEPGFESEKGKERRVAHGSTVAVAS